MAPTFSLGNVVWFDVNNDGIQSADEVGVAGVDVYLFVDADGDGVPDGDPVASTTTVADGLYLFDGLAPGNYVVGIPGSEFDVGETLHGYLSSDPTETDADTDVDLDDNGSQTSGFVLSGSVTLVGGEPTGEVPDNDPNTADPNENLSVDFGFYQPEFDLALRKVLASPTSGVVAVGDTVVWTMTVLNQGDVIAESIELVDYVPADLTAADPAWTAGANGPVITIDGPIAPGAEASVTFATTVNAGATGNIDNLAEITAATPVDEVGDFLVMANGLVIPDRDSTPDASNVEVAIDNVVDNTGGDEDDHDIASVAIATTENPTGTTTTTTPATSTPNTPLAVTGRTAGQIVLLGVMLIAAGALFIVFGRNRREDYAEE